MASFAKVYNAKIRRSSSQDSPPLSNRTGLNTQEIPPQLCHLTGDALDVPFPPIALGGYIKYYRTHSGPGERRKTVRSPSPSRNVRNDLQDDKTKRRASSGSILFRPFLSHVPKPSPSNEIPPTSQLFGTRTKISSPIPSSYPQVPKKRYLSIIPEASRETIRVDLDDSAIFTSKPRKPRVVSSPPALLTPDKLSSLTSSDPKIPVLSDHPSSPITSSPVRSADIRTVSRTSALRRSRRRLLRTPSVKNDFAPYAKELMNMKSDSDIPRLLSRQYSSGSDVTDEEGTMSATESVNTAMTSLLDPSSSPSSPSLPVSPTKHRAESSSHKDNDILRASSNTSPTPLDRSQSPQIFDLFHSAGSGLLDDWDLQKFMTMAAGNNDAGKRDSWASFTTAKSSPDVLPAVYETAENPTRDMLGDEEFVIIGRAL